MSERGVWVASHVVRFLESDLAAALILSQIVYWSKPGKTGHTKLRVVRNGVKWLAKSAPHWTKELGITNKQAYRGVKVLEERGLIERSVMRFDGTPMNHFRLTEKGLALAENILDDLPEKEDQSCQNVPMNLPSEVG